MNNQNPFDTQIEAYFTGTMSPEEKKAFEQELKSNNSLKEVFKPYQLFDKAVEVQGEAELRVLARNMAATMPPMPVPQLSIWEQIGLFFTKAKSYDKVNPSGQAQSATWRMALGGLSTAVVACLLYANIFVMPYGEIAASQNFGFAAESVGTLGEDTKTLFANAQKLYESGQKQALEKMAIDTEGGAAVAGNYYLAHLELKNKNFDNALTAFDKILQPNNIKILESESMSIGRVKINRLLAILGKNKDKDEALRLANQLAADPDCKNDLDKINALKKELNSLWRFFTWKK
jgi:tetratricopeptide (TPR) repeat protein